LEPTTKGDEAMARKGVALLKKKAVKRPATSAPAAVRDLSRDLKRVKGLVAKAKLAGVEEGLSYGAPSLKVMGKFLARVREPDILVLMCALEEKDFLMQNDPGVYFETDHYKGWPAVLIRLSKIGDDELKHRLQIAWRMQAPKKLLASVDGGAPAAKAKKR
jgi:hypothetical protein